MIITLILCLLLGTVSIDAVISEGKCAKINDDKSFTPSKYLGSWYEIERFNYIFEDFLKCLVATYGSINSTFVSVHNEGINMYS